MVDPTLVIIAPVRWWHHPVVVIGAAVAGLWAIGALGERRRNPEFFTANGVVHPIRNSQGLPRSE